MPNGLVFKVLYSAMILLVTISLTTLHLVAA
jgi:hypothetical protein